MKILVDGTAIFLKRTGVGQYTYRTLQHLFKIDKKNTYYIVGFLFMGKKFNPPFPKIPKNAHYRLVRLIPSKVYNVFTRKVWAMPLDLISFSRPDVALFFNFVKTPTVFAKKTVVVIYDVVFELYPEYVEAKNLKYMRKYVGHSAKNSDYIVTISQNAKEEIVEQYGVSEDKLTIINPSVDHDVFYPRQQKEIDAVKKKHGVNRDYLLFIGTLEPRKNVLGVIEAYKKLPPKLQKKYALVLVGDKGWLDSEIQSALSSNKNLEIIVTGYLPDQEMPALYSGASVFVFPAFYEGFGMPPLEAMATGTAVVTSNTSSLPEVVAKAGATVDPHDNQQLAAQIEKVLVDSAYRKKLESAGLKRAKEFSWSKSAKQWKSLLDKIEKVL